MLARHRSRDKICPMKLGRPENWYVIRGVDEMFPHIEPRFDGKWVDSGALRAGCMEMAMLRDGVIQPLALFVTGRIETREDGEVAEVISPRHE
jgi:hypothetical protein